MKPMLQILALATLPHSLVFGLLALYFHPILKIPLLPLDPIDSDSAVRTPYTNHRRMFPMPLLILLLLFAFNCPR
jgi:hypothetical protein